MQALIELLYLQAEQHISTSFPMSEWHILFKPLELRHVKTGFCLCVNKGADQLRSNCIVSLFLSHLLIAGCDIGVQISVCPYVRSFVRPSTFTSKFSFLDISDSCESETLHSNCP